IEQRVGQVEAHEPERADLLLADAVDLADAVRVDGIEPRRAGHARHAGRGLRALVEGLRPRLHRGELLGEVLRARLGGLAEAREGLALPGRADVLLLALLERERSLRVGGQEVAQLAEQRVVPLLDKRGVPARLVKLPRAERQLLLQAFARCALLGRAVLDLLQLPRRREGLRLEPVPLGVQRAEGGLQRFPLLPDRLEVALGVQEERRVAPAPFAGEVVELESALRAQAVLLAQPLGLQQARLQLLDPPAQMGPLLPGLVELALVRRAWREGGPGRVEAPPVELGLKLRDAELGLLEGLPEEGEAVAVVRLVVLHGRLGLHSSVPLRMPHRWSAEWRSACAGVSPSCQPRSSMARSTSSTSRRPERPVRTISRCPWRSSTRTAPVRVSYTLRAEASPGVWARPARSTRTKRSNSRSAPRTQRSAAAPGARSATCSHGLPGATPRNVATRRATRNPKRRSATRERSPSSAAQRPRVWAAGRPTRAAKARNPATPRQASARRVATRAGTGSLERPASRSPTAMAALAAAARAQSRLRTWLGFTSDPPKTDDGPAAQRRGGDEEQHEPARRALPGQRDLRERGAAGRGRGATGGGRRGGGGGRGRQGEDGRRRAAGGRGRGRGARGRRGSGAAGEEEAHGNGAAQETSAGLDADAEDVALRHGGLGVVEAQRRLPWKRAAGKAPCPQGLAVAEERRAERPFEDPASADLDRGPGAKDEGLAGGGGAVEPAGGGARSGRLVEASVGVEVEGLGRLRRQRGRKEGEGRSKSAQERSTAHLGCSPAGRA